MAIPVYKLKIIEKMALVFEAQQIKRAAPHYRKYYKQVSAEIMSELTNTNKLTKTSVNRIAKMFKIDVSFVQYNMNIMRLQAEIEQALIEGRITANNANKMINYVERTGSLDIREIAKVSTMFLKTFLKNNRKYVARINRETVIQVNRITKEIQNSQSQRIFKKYKAIRNRAKSFEALRSELRATFQNDAKKIETVLRTEIHATNEQVKLSLQSLSGYTHKIWHTEGDLKVRATHARINNNKVKITEYFIIGNSRASFPGDPKLPVGERINCRCYLTFEKEKKNESNTKKR